MLCWCSIQDCSQKSYSTEMALFFHISREKNHGNILQENCNFMCFVSTFMHTHRHINMPITNTFGCTDGSNDRRSSSEVL